MCKPIRLTVWLEDYPRVTLGFNTCTEAEAHLADLRVCGVLGGALQRFAIDKEVR